MIALVDCNNFYASCERLFRPELNGGPVVVLSNNDGCIIPRSDEAKDLGIKMGMVWHLMDKRLQDKVIKFSRNYTLYADMSARVMNNLARFTDRVNVYSIDECFLQLYPNTEFELLNYGHHIRRSIVQNTGIPISVGIAPSKTLAKMANKLAKAAGGVFLLDTQEKITEAVKDYPVEKLWGIGHAGFKKLLTHGISTAGQLRQQPLEWIRKIFTIQGVRMWYEPESKGCTDKYPIPLLSHLSRISSLNFV
jgi:DNA polymerase V